MFLEFYNTIAYPHDGIHFGQNSYLFAIEYDLWDRSTGVILTASLYLPFATTKRTSYAISMACSAKPATSITPPTRCRLPATRTSTSPDFCSVRTSRTACSMLGTT